MKSGFGARLRGGVLVGAFVAGGIVAMDVLLGKWDGLVLPRMITLALTVVATATIWAWLTGLRGRDDA